MNDHRWLPTLFLEELKQGRKQSFLSLPSFCSRIWSCIIANIQRGGERKSSCQDERRRKDNTLATLGKIV